jgi:hypothetical protein
MTSTVPKKSPRIQGRQIFKVPRGNAAIVRAVALLACPFCRTLFTSAEAAICPACELALVPIAQLSPKPGSDEEDEAGIPRDPPELRPFPFLFLGSRRGGTLAGALATLSLFWAPWVRLERPDLIELSGSDLARAGAPWLWAGALGCFVVIPLLLSRRTIRQLLGVRAITIAFALMTTVETVLLVTRPPIEAHYFSAHLSYGWGLWCSLLSSLATAVVALGLGRMTVQGRASKPKPRELDPRLS